MIDALLGIFIISICVQMVSLCIQTYYKVENQQVFFSNWQLEEYNCEIWCESFWFLDD